MREDRLRDLLLTIRRALLMVVRWIEKEYGIEPSDGGSNGI